jgi:hypothetical protein
MHMLGGVRDTAPHATGNGHCFDEYDRMCYEDGPGVDLEYFCPNSSRDALFDCNHDDYYTTRPPATGYLATHWNTADSRFLFSPECDALRSQIAGLKADIASLQAELHSSSGETPSPSQKASIVAQIREAQKELAEAEARRRLIGCNR